MATQLLTVPLDTWLLIVNASAADQEVVITDPNRVNGALTFKWAIMDNTTPPVFAVEDGHPVDQNLNTFSIKVKTGEVLFIGDPNLSYQVTSTVNAA